MKLTIYMDTGAFYTIILDNVSTVEEAAEYFTTIAWLPIYLEDKTVVISINHISCISEV